MKSVFTFLIAISLFSVNTVAQNAGLFQTYAIVNINSAGNTYREGNVGPENFHPPLSGVDFGSVTSIILNGAEIKTFKNGGGDVTGAQLHYRVYPQGGTPGGYTTLALGFGSNLTNPGDQVWMTTNAGVNLASGLPSGNYVFNVYFTISANTGNGGPFTDGNAASPIVATFIVTSTTLPVSLVSFSAKAANNRMARLDWATATETNNAHFDVERSQDALSFVRVGRVQGQGTTAARRAYQFTDEAPATGINYYRLKQTDTDGKYAYSPVRAVAISTNGEFVVLGNPATEQVRIAGLEPGTSLELTDLTGQVRARQTASQTEANVDVRHLPSGTYLLRVAEPTGMQTRRVLVNR